MTTLIDRLRTQAETLRRKPTPLVDLIPMLTEAADALEQAIAQEQKPKFTRFDVLVITTAYEQGYGKGLQDRGVPNVYVQDSPAFHAWQLGYEEGQMRLKQQSKEPKPDGYEDMLNALKDERFSI